MPTVMNPFTSRMRDTPVRISRSQCRNDAAARLSPLRSRRLRRGGAAALDVDIRTDTAPSVSGQGSRSGAFQGALAGAIPDHYRADTGALFMYSWPACWRDGYIDCRKFSGTVVRPQHYRLDVRGDLCYAADVLGCSIHDNNLPVYMSEGLDADAGDGRRNALALASAPVRVTRQRVVGYRWRSGSSIRIAFHTDYRRKGMAVTQAGGDAAHAEGNASVSDGLRCQSRYPDYLLRALRCVTSLAAPEELFFAVLDGLLR